MALGAAAVVLTIGLAVLAAVATGLTGAPVGELVGLPAPSTDAEAGRGCGSAGHRGEAPHNAHVVPPDLVVREPTWYSDATGWINGLRRVSKPPGPRGTDWRIPPADQPPGPDDGDRADVTRPLTASPGIRVRGKAQPESTAVASLPGTHRAGHGGPAGERRDPARYRRQGLVSSSCGPGTPGAPARVGSRLQTAAGSSFPGNAVEGGPSRRDHLARAASVERGALRVRAGRPAGCRSPPGVRTDSAPPRRPLQGPATHDQEIPRRTASRACRYIARLSRRRSGRARRRTGRSRCWRR